jgi:hypothetical protein
MSQQAVLADIIPNSAVEIFSQKTEGTKTKAATIWKQIWKLTFAHLAILKSCNS